MGIPLMAYGPPTVSSLHRTGLTALLGVLCVAAASGAQPGPTVPAELRTYTSRFYEIHTNLTPAEARDLAAHMDAVFAEYDRRFASFRQRQRRPMPLYLFRTREQYIEFLKGHGVNAENSGGMFVYQPTVSGLLTWVQDRSRGETFRVLQHEGFHQFAWAYIGPSLPIWANEGMAEYFEDGILVKGQMVLGQANAARITSVKEAVASGKAVDFDELLNIDSKTWHETLVKNPQRARLLYDQSWSIVHFLIHADNGRYRPAFEQMLGHISRGQTVDRAFRRAFGTEDTRLFRQRWEEYVKALEPDALNVAMARMEFIGQAMLFLRQRGEPIPPSMDELKQRLQRLGYRAWRSTHGIRVEFDARDDRLFEYPLPTGGRGQFRLLEPARDGLPPRLTAPGLRPEPTLIWVTDPEGQVYQEIEFR